MAAFLSTRIAAVWIGLVLATTVSWVLGTDHGIDDPRTVSVLILLIAFVKVRFVGRYFMELRNAPVILVGLFEGWVVVVGTSVVVMYLVG